MINLIRYTIILIFMLTLMSCQSNEIRPPKFEDCRVLSKSIYCFDLRLNNIKIDSIIDDIQSNDALSESQRIDLINYFEDNREKINKNNEYEISIDYINYFKGYSLTNPKDRRSLMNWQDSINFELERYRNTYGPINNRR